MPALRRLSNGRNTRIIISFGSVSELWTNTLPFTNDPFETHARSEQGDEDTSPISLHVHAQSSIPVSWGLHGHQGSHHLHAQV